MKHIPSLPLLKNTYAVWSEELIRYFLCQVLQMKTWQGGYIGTLQGYETALNGIL
jgi:hypothetical protein